MQALRSTRNLYRSLSPSSSLSAPSRTLVTLKTSSSSSPISNPPNRHRTSSYAFLSPNLLASPWCVTQQRGSKVMGSDVRPGNIVERKGRMYEVIKADHIQQGRGGAVIQVELRDVDSGHKANERFRTDEALKRVFVQERPFTCFYRDGDNVVLMDPKTFEQMEVHKDLFGKAAPYVKEEMNGIVVQMFDGKALSASVPKQVTCTVKDAQVHIKGVTATPRYKKVLLDNGLTVQVPSHIVAGDEIIVNTIDDSYVARA